MRPAVISRFTVIVALTVSTTACAGIRQLTRVPPHESYGGQLRETGLNQTALGQEWFAVGAKALQSPIAITTPFQETGYFSPAKPMAAGYRMTLQRGRRLSIEVTFETAEPARLFVDLFHLRPGDDPRTVASLEDGARALVHDVDRDGDYVVRVQPELLRGGRYTISERTLASLPYPVPGSPTKIVQSRFGDERDAGTREHEGIDLFADRGTPVVAVVEGTARASTNPLGGNVVWLNDRASGRTFYYAHLDRWAIDGTTTVRAGDRLGYVGSTGNARTTSPHLHFGVYYDGAIDPLPFLAPDDPIPTRPLKLTPLLGELARVETTRTRLRSDPRSPAAKSLELTRHTIMRVLAQSRESLRVALPDETIGYVDVNAVGAAAKPLRRVTLPAVTDVLERPFAPSPVVDTLERNSQVDVFGTFNGYDLLRLSGGLTGWVEVEAIGK